MKKLLLLSTLLLTSCQPVSKLTTLLDIVTASAEVLLPTLGQLTPEQSVIVRNYISATGAAVKLTAAEMQSADTTFQKITKIADAWQAAILSPGVLAQLPPNVANLIQIVIQASLAVIAEVKSELNSPSMKIAADQNKAVKLSLSYADKRKLSAISKRADVLVRK